MTASQDLASVGPHLQMRGHVSELLSTHSSVAQNRLADVKHVVGEGEWPVLVES